MITIYSKFYFQDLLFFLSCAITYKVSSSIFCSNFESILPKSLPMLVFLTNSLVRMR